MSNKKNVLIIVTVILLAVVLISSSTYAYWKYHFINEYQTNVSFTITSNFSCSASGGGNITHEEVELAPSYCSDNRYMIKREITTNVVNNSSSNVVMDLWLDIKDISSGLSSTDNFRYAISDNSNWCNSGNLISSGSFYNTSDNQQVHILNNDIYPTKNSSKTYWLYIWLDYIEEEDTTMDQQFHFELGGECRENNENPPNAPELVDGLIAVNISPKGDVVTSLGTRGIDNSVWYDYSNQRWANAVLVKETGRKTRTENSFPGTIIAKSDILAYYVWIPRYSYNVWQYSGVSSAGNERTIDIKFVDVGTIDNATKNGDWYTHPAFWWDNDYDGDREEGEELSGIWVGKFETSHATINSNLSCNSNSCDSTKYNGIRVLPNVETITANKISSFYYVSRGMESNDNVFGLNSSSADSHIMKNSEWGAVAYLSHSKYGINKQIRVNNVYSYIENEVSKEYLTGCGSAIAAASQSSVCDIRYGTASAGIYPQSTTENVTGIFDMSGGVYEYVMGVYNQTAKSSGFNTTTTLWPSAVYYNNYSLSAASCAFSECGGHALNETNEWYSDLDGFVNVSGPWFIRGGETYDTIEAGIFSYAAYTGAGAGDCGFRLTLMPK